MQRSLSILLCAGLVACASSSDEIIPDTCELSLVFADEFDDLSVNARELRGKRWIAHTPWYGDFGDAIFIDPRPDYPFVVKDGTLRITAEKREHKGVPDQWVSGLLAAADRSGVGPGAMYGYFEARMKMPPGKGVWPAFWLMPQKRQPNTNNLEVDIVEYYGHATDEYKVVQHVWKKGDKNRPRGSTVHVEDGLLTREFNTFGADISPEWIVYMFNGEEVWRHPTPPEHDTKLYPLVNLALGSGWPIDETPSPSVLEVDYVRVWARGARNDCGLGLN